MLTYIKTENNVTFKTSNTSKMCLYKDLNVHDLAMSHEPVNVKNPNGHWLYIV